MAEHHTLSSIDRSDPQMQGGLSEWQRLVTNLAELRSMAEQMTARTLEMSELVADIESNRADTRALRTKLNKIALQLGLSPLPRRAIE